MASASTAGSARGERGRGGAGVSHGVNSNLENIFAHTIVLPGHPLAAQSANRGHIHREVTTTFPGPGRRTSSPEIRRHDHLDRWHRVVRQGGLPGCPALRELLVGVIVEVIGR